MRVRGIKTNNSYLSATNNKDMNQNLQELTEKIYREGVGKAEARSAQILSQAKEEASEIIRKAELRAAELVEQAEQESADLKVKNESEMRLASRQALGTLKQQITDLLIWEVFSEPVNKAFDDTDFMKQIIGKLIDFWIGHYGEEERLSVLLPDKDFESLKEYFNNRAQATLQSGVLIEHSSQMKNGFRISPESGRFKVSFTAEDFENYFKTFARPRAIKLLFGEDG